MRWEGCVKRVPNNVGYGQAVVELLYVKVDSYIAFPVVFEVFVKGPPEQGAKWGE